ncbi:class I SAM-dependent methyltransferase [Gulosibacter hominis]|uniref:class I SAM-dependent methyltransferase n=1 Tax=Gulosibacter hominis TaxID=2770504 RepID=UPI001919CA05|nr:class I SAM-dependent methyltransferase [Gulosibacter hominis]
MTTQLTVPGPIDVVLREAAATGGINGTVVVLDEPDAQLVRATLAAGAERVIACCDTGFTVPLPESAIERELTELGGSDSVDDADAGETVALAVGLLPKSLAELAEQAQELARQLPAARVILGAREKHLTRSMNEVLEQHYARVRASLGYRKSRALVASDALTNQPPRIPATAQIAELDLTVCAFGGAFAGAKLDIGTRLLLETLETAPPATEPSTVIDLGCGTGILASWAARNWPVARIIATDRSAAAVRSATATAAANGVTVTAHRADAGAGLPDACADLVLLNPPFHEGREVDRTMANHLFAAAARLLKPGGELYTVFNSHLRHRPQLERLVGPTEQLAANAKFIVTRSVRQTASAVDRKR